nr:HWTX-XVIIb3 precursor [Cyriopagopus schmidti]
MATLTTSLFQRSPEKNIMKSATLLALSFLLIASCFLICEAEHSRYEEHEILEENMGDVVNLEQRSCAKPGEMCMRIKCCDGQCGCNRGTGRCFCK